MKAKALLDQYSTMTKKQARNTYEPATDRIEDPSRLREFNELQHRVTGHLRDLIPNCADRYPDDAICEIIWHGAHALKIDRAVQRLLQNTMESVRLASKPHRRSGAGAAGRRFR